MNLAVYRGSNSGSRKNVISRNDFVNRKTLHSPVTRATYEKFKQINDVTRSSERLYSWGRFRHYSIPRYDLVKGKNIHSLVTKITSSTFIKEIQKSRGKKKNWWDGFSWQASTNDVRIASRSMNGLDLKKFLTVLLSATFLGLSDDDEHKLSNILPERIYILLKKEPKTRSADEK